MSPDSTPFAAPLDPADLIAAAVLMCPAVAGLRGGRFGGATTYLPGRRVEGVRIDDVEVEVGVIGRYPYGVAVIAGQVRSAVAAIAPGVPVTVNVEDLALPGDIVRDGTIVAEGAVLVATTTIAPASATVVATGPATTDPIAAGSTTAVFVDPIDPALPDSVSPIAAGPVTTVTDLPSTMSQPASLIKEDLS